jgi:hypothetical protein
VVCAVALDRMLALQPLSKERTVKELANNVWVTNGSWISMLV